MPVLQLLHVLFMQIKEEPVERNYTLPGQENKKFSETDLGPTQLKFTREP